MLSQLVRLQQTQEATQCFDPACLLSIYCIVWCWLLDELQKRYRRFFTGASLHRTNSEYEYSDLPQTGSVRVSEVGGQ